MSKWYEILFGKPSTTNQSLEASPPLLESIPVYLYNSVETFWAQITSLPRALKHLWVHESSRVITTTFLYTLKDIFPLLLLDSALYFLYGYVQEDAPLFSAYGCLYVALELVNMSITLFATRALIKNTVTSICAPTALNRIEKNNQALTDSACTPKCKGSFVMLNGAINETTAYYSNFLAIYVLAQIPVIGKYLAEAISVYATGRYVGGLTARRCRKHEYLQSEATLSLGLIHKGFEYLLWWGLKSSIGLPSPILMRIINELPLLLTIAIAANHDKPLIVSRNKRTFVDPVEIYENITAAVFKGACFGFKDEIKKLLTGPPAVIPWAKIGNQLLCIAKHPYAVNTRNLFLPQMFHDWHSFINEPMISPRWTAVQKQLLVILNSLEEGSRSNIVNIAQKSPKKAAYLFEFLFGFPKPIAKILLDIMGNHNYMVIVEAIRRKLELYEARKETSLADLGPLLPLRIAERKPLLKLAEPNLLSAPLPKNDILSPPTKQPDINKFFTKPIKPPVQVDPNKHLVKRYSVIPA